MKQALAVWISLGATMVACSSAATDTERDDDGAFEQTTQAISQGQLLSQSSPLATSTVNINGCTGTLIGPRHVLSAAHCRPKGGDFVLFYRGSRPIPGAATTVRTVYMPYGVDLSRIPPRIDPFLDQFANWDSGLSDSTGKYADLVVLELESPAPSLARVATLASSYLGNNAYVSMVGVGAHDGQPNPSMLLMATTSKVYSGNDADGHFLTDSAYVNPGDSGGPAYTLQGSQPTVHGVLSGTRWEWAQRAKYTSVSFHIQRILRALGEVRLNGNLVYDVSGVRSSQKPSIDACAVQCIQSTTCGGYTFDIATSTCTEHTSVAGVWPVKRVGKVSGYRRSAGTGACEWDGTVCRF